MTLSQDEGFALRDRLAAGEKITITLHLTVPPLTNVATAWHYAVLPGMSDEQIQIQMHTDGYFQAAEDNNGGMASGLELARHYAALPKTKRPRTMVLIMFPDHHHGEVAHGRKAASTRSALVQGGAQADARASVRDRALHVQRRPHAQQHDERDALERLGQPRVRAHGVWISSSTSATRSTASRTARRTAPTPRRSTPSITSSTTPASTRPSWCRPKAGPRHPCVRVDHRQCQPDDDRPDQGSGLAVRRQRLDRWPVLTREQRPWRKPRSSLSVESE